MKQDEKEKVHALQVRIPLPLYEKLKYAAKENHRTINAEVCMHLAQADLPSVTGLDNLLTAHVIRPYIDSLENLHGLIGQYEDRLEGMVSSMANAQQGLLNQAAIAARLQRLLVGRRNLPESLLPLSDQALRSTMDFHIPWKQDVRTFEQFLSMRNEQQREVERDLGDVTRARLAAEKCWREVKEMMERLGYKPPGSIEGDPDEGVTKTV